MEPVAVLIVAVSDFNKLCEISADMIEYTVKDHLDIIFMQFFAKCGKVCVCAEPVVYFGIIHGIIAVCNRLKNRTEIDSVESHFLYVRNCVLYLFKSVFGVLRIIVCLGTSTKS